MDVSADLVGALQRWYPFSECGNTFVTDAVSSAVYRIYTAGETLIKHGQEASWLGLVVEGTICTIPAEENSKWGNLKLSPGCFMGLEAVNGSGVYAEDYVCGRSAKVLFWPRNEIERLDAEYPVFHNALSGMIRAADISDESWDKIEKQVARQRKQPEANVSAVKPAEWGEPVLYMDGPSLAAYLFHILIAFAVFLVLFCVTNVLMTGLARRPYASGTLTALFFLYVWLSYQAWKREKLTVTSRHLVFLSAFPWKQPYTVRLDQILSAADKPDFLSDFFPVGDLIIHTTGKKTALRAVTDPDLGRALINSFMKRLQPQGQVSLAAVLNSVRPNRTALFPEEAAGYTAPAETVRRAPLPLSEETNGAGSEKVPNASAGKPQAESLPEPLVFHAHWARLVGLTWKPVLLLCALVIFWISGVSRGWELFQSGETGKWCALILVFLAGWIFYNYLDWKNDVYIIEADCIKDINRKPLTHEDINITMMEKIQSTRFTRQGIFQIMLNYGTLYILAGLGELSFDYVPNPDQVQKALLARMDEYYARKKSEEEQHQDEYIQRLVNSINGSPRP